MPNGFTYSHLEWLGRYAYTDHDATLNEPTTFEVLLYDDAVDEISFRDDLDDITTEPDDGNYSRATLQFPADLELSSDPLDRYVDIRPNSATFDFDGVTGEVDHAGVVWEANVGDDDAEFGPYKHLMARCELDERYNLADIKYTYAVDAGWQLHTLF